MSNDNGLNELQLLIDCIDFYQEVNRQAAVLIDLFGGHFRGACHFDAQGSKTKVSFTIILQP